MMLDEHLVNKARSEADRLAVAEREALLAKADYHTAVRRLHLAGGSLRAVAQALGLSHQRVQQIVSGAGGTWWQRVWHSRNKRDATCTYCGRPPGEVDKLIAGPNVYICDACVLLAETVLKKGNARGPMALATGLAARCSFCNRRKSKGRPIMTTADAKICSECLRMCRDILEGRK